MVSKTLIPRPEWEKPADKKPLWRRILLGVFGGLATIFSSAGTQGRAQVFAPATGRVRGMIQDKKGVAGAGQGGVSRTDFNLQQEVQKQITLGRENALEENVAYTQIQAYTVKQGDTLRSIATSFYGDEGKWRDIRNANTGKISNADLISPGQVLTIPGGAIIGVSLTETPAQTTDAAAVAIVAMNTATAVTAAGNASQYLTLTQAAVARNDVPGAVTAASYAVASAMVATAAAPGSPAANKAMASADSAVKALNTLDQTEVATVIWQSAQIMDAANAGETGGGTSGVTSGSSISSGTSGATTATAGATTATAGTAPTADSSFTSGFTIAGVNFGGNIQSLDLGQSYGPITTAVMNTTGLSGPVTTFGMVLLGLAPVVGIGVTAINLADAITVNVNNSTLADSLNLALEDTGAPLSISIEAQPDNSIFNGLNPALANMLAEGTLTFAQAQSIQASLNTGNFSVAEVATINAAINAEGGVPGASIGILAGGGVSGGNSNATAANQGSVTINGVTYTGAQVAAAPEAAIAMAVALDNISAKVQARSTNVSIDALSDANNLASNNINAVGPPATKSANDAVSFAIDAVSAAKAFGEALAVSTNQQNISPELSQAISQVNQNIAIGENTISYTNPQISGNKANTPQAQANLNAALAAAVESLNESVQSLNNTVASLTDVAFGQGTMANAIAVEGSQDAADIAASMSTSISPTALGAQGSQGTSGVTGQGHGTGQGLGEGQAGQVGQTSQGQQGQTAQGEVAQGQEGQQGQITQSEVTQNSVFGPSTGLSQSELDAMDVAVAGSPVNITAENTPEALSIDVAPTSSFTPTPVTESSLAPPTTEAAPTTQDVTLADINNPTTNFESNLTADVVTDTITEAEAQSINEGIAAQTDTSPNAGVAPDTGQAAPTAQQDLGNLYTGQGSPSLSAAPGASSAGNISGGPAFGGFTGPVGTTISCFIADTPILMADGTHKPIEKIELGDLLQSWDWHAKKAVLVPVTQVTRSTPADSLHRINGVQVTSMHRFAVGAYVWKRAHELVVGDVVWGPNGEKTLIKTADILNTTPTVFNLRVGRFERTANFYVGDEEAFYLVHNDGDGGDSGGAGGGSGGDSGTGSADGEGVGTASDSSSTGAGTGTGGPGVGGGTGESDTGVAGTPGPAADSAVGPADSPADDPGLNLGNAPASARK